MEKILGFEFSDIFIVEGDTLSLKYHKGYSNISSVRLKLNGKRGITVKAVKLGKSILIPDVRKEKNYVKRAKNIRSELAVPIKIEDKIIGALNVESAKLFGFSENDKKLLEILASHAAIAITNLKRQQTLSALNEYAQNLNKAQKLTEIYEIALDAMEKILGFEYASIFMIQGKILRLVAQRKYSKKLKISLPLEGKKGITVKAAKTGKSILVPDVRKNDLYVKAGVKGMLSELAVPIKIGKKVLGVLNVEGKRVAAFSQNDKALLETLASHAATAIANLDRREKLQELSRKIANLMESSTRIMRVKNMHKRLKVIARAIQNFGWRRVVISLRDENLEGTDIVTVGLTKEERRLLIERKTPGHVWRERLGQKFERFKIGEFYYLPWNDPWIREHIHGIPPESSLEEATTYAGVPSRLSPEEMVDWHPQDMIYAPLRTPEGKIVGILSMDDPVDGRKPTKEALIPLELFLHQAAITIENFQLIESLRMARKKLEEYTQTLEQRVEERTRELRKSQEKLLKAQKLAVIGELAGMVGHDLRNPLTSIAGAQYYLKKKLASRIDGKVMEMLELIEKNIAYSNKIINDLLEYSREIEVEHQETTPKTVLKEALDLIKIPKKVQLKMYVRNTPKIWVDIGKMKRVCVNIIKNALEAMPQGGILEITSKKRKDKIEFRFADSGVGMSEEVLEKLGTPLFTTKAKGMGFGLPICKRIVEAHGGSIFVESKIGKGTIFTVVVPIKPKVKKGGEKYG
jgi:signal transduction histidine kinase/putative methionine-R-sulfoxide reductase with GAF domain